MTPPLSHPVARSGFQLLIGVALLFSLVVGLRVWHLEQTPPEILLEQTVNPNQADVALLVCLPGLGPQRAQAIVGYRMQQGKQGHRPVYACPEDLLAIPGIGPGILRQITPYLRFDR